MTRRRAIGRLGGLAWGCRASAERGEATPQLAPGTPLSAERMAGIQAFRTSIDGLASKFEKRSHRGSWTMPYRLFRPTASGKAPLVLYLHGSGGLGDDNEKQLALGNVFGTFVWALPENQRRFPCYVLAPQTDRGWAQYKQTAGGKAEVVRGFGDGARMALTVVERLQSELPIDERRLYVAGQSMGGAGAWNLVAHRPKAFAAAVICCGSRTPDDVTPAAAMPLWVFHGAADHTVPVEASRERVTALRRAGGRPIYTEYEGVDHNVWEWAFTEPALIDWTAQRQRQVART